MKTIRVNGKCILMGEQSVVRGKSAVVFPLKSKFLELQWNFTPRNIQEIVVTTESWKDPVDKCFAAAAEKIKIPTGLWELNLSSTIPMRAGLGSSAALSVALTRMFRDLELLSDAEIFSTALHMENVFHGTSSGLDIAAVMHEKPIRFVRGQPPRPFTPVWQPNLYLYDTGLRSSTKECLEKVVALNRPDLDVEMGLLTDTVVYALQTTQDAGLPMLEEAMTGALELFRAWGLMPLEIEKLLPHLLSMGVLAVKPTGSGDGGFLLCLFDREMNEPNLIPIF